MALPLGRSTWALAPIGLVCGSNCSLMGPGLGPLGFGLGSGWEGVFACRAFPKIYLYVYIFFYIRVLACKLKYMHKVSHTEGKS